MKPKQQCPTAVVIKSELKDYAFHEHEALPPLTLV